MNGIKGATKMGHSGAQLAAYPAFELSGIAEKLVKTLLRTGGVCMGTVEADSQGEGSRFPTGRRVTTRSRVQWSWRTSPSLGWLGCNCQCPRLGLSTIIR